MALERHHFNLRAIQNNSPCLAYEQLPNRSRNNRYGYRSQLEIEPQSRIFSEEQSKMNQKILELKSKVFKLPNLKTSSVPVNRMTPQDKFKTIIMNIENLKQHGSLTPNQLSFISQLLRAKQKQKLD